jgi:GT2 family glycosyltransferase
VSAIQSGSLLPEYCVVVPTLGDRRELRTVIECVRRQTSPPQSVIVAACPSVPQPEWFPVDDPTCSWLQSPRKGAAAQRNFAAELANSEIVAFFDDDISFGDDLAAKVLQVFAHDVDKRIGAISPRMARSGHPQPSALLRRYYRWQAGYDDATYGAKLFGFAINTYPCYEAQRMSLIEADWLNSPCLFVRKEEFSKVRFPDFEGYSYGEDIYLTASIKKNGKKLFFMSDVAFEHHAAVGSYKAHLYRLTRMKTLNQGRIAREVMDLRGWRYASKKLVHLLFVTACLVRGCKKGWWREVAGLWSA